MTPAWRPGDPERRHEPARVPCGYHQEILDGLERIQKRLDRLSVAVFGPDEHPELGFIVRLDRVEQSSRAQFWVIVTVLAPVMGFLAVTAVQRFIGGH